MSIFKSARTALLVAAIAAMPLSAQALTPQEATDLTDTIVDEVLSYVNSDLSLEEKQTAFRETMDRYADTSAIGRYVLGISWRSATPAQQQAFTEAFREYLAQKYGSQFSGYEGGEIEIGAATDRGNRGIVVESTLIRSNGGPLVVQWQFTDRSGQPLLIDIIAEGISLLTTERHEIALMLERRGGDLDALIADLPTLH